MPTDYRRITGPDNSVPYNLFINSKDKFFRDKAHVFNKENKRKDGRSVNEHRQIFLKCGVVSQAKGSAYIELNKTKVIASVFDPREIPKKTDYSTKGQIYCEFKYAPFSCPKRRLHTQDVEEKYNSGRIKRVLESVVCRHEFPNFQVDVYILVLENDGSALSAAINAAGLALAHAGIPMYDVITSVTLGIQGNIKLTDPTLEEENFCSFAALTNNQEGSKYENHGIIVLAVCPMHNQISEFFQFGNLNIEQLKEGVSSLTNSTKELVPLVKKCLVKYVENSIKEVVTNKDA